MPADEALRTKSGSLLEALIKLQLHESSRAVLIQMVDCRLEMQSGAAKCLSVLVTFYYELTQNTEFVPRWGHDMPSEG